MNQNRLFFFIVLFFFPIFSFSAVDEESVKNLNSQEKQKEDILVLMKENPKITKVELVVKLGVSLGIINNRISKLIKKGRITRMGPRSHGGYWKVSQEEAESAHYDVIEEPITVSSSFLAIRRIEDLNLSNRTKNALKSKKIHYLYELVEKTDNELKGIPGLGQMSLTEIKSLLQSMNWTLGQQLDAETLYTLGVKFYEGEEVEKNPEQAFKLWDRATKWGHLDAQYSLAYMYFKGEGVKENPEKAIEIWTEAAKKGHKESQKSLDDRCSSTYQ